MNKKYIVTPEGKVTVVTDTGEKIDKKDKYTKNTDEILSLENVVELIENKVNNLKKYLKETKIKIKDNKSTIITMPIFFLVSLGLVSLVTNSLVLTTGLGFAFVVGGIIFLTPEVIKLIKGKKNIKEYEEKISGESHRINKITKRINTLSEDKTPVRAEKVNKLIDVKTISNFNFDASDYFIEQYQADKNNKSLTKGHPKVRKLTKLDNKIIKL